MVSSESPQPGGSIEKDDSARDSAGDAAQPTCGVAEDVEAGQVASMNADGQTAFVNGINGEQSATGYLGPSLVAISQIAAMPAEADGAPARTGTFNPARTSSFPPKQRPSMAGQTAMAGQAVKFKQAPAHDEHHETSATIIFTPKETYDHIVATGVAKTKITLAKQVTQGVLAGFYISFSFMLCMTVGGQIDTIQHEYPGLYSFILGSVGFPLGLTIIMVVGADLFTSSCMYMITAWWEGRIATYYVLKNWFIAWWANLAGCLIMAQLVVWAHLFAGSKANFPIYLAHKKTSDTFGATLVKGIICNWLVNLAVWMANSARDVTGKAVGVYLPVSAFVTLGTEHVIANQFELSLAKMLGSGMPLRTIIASNWVPATIGNIIGGAFFVGTLYAGVYGTLYERMWYRTTQLYIWLIPRRARERISAVYGAVSDKLYNMVDWDAITRPPNPLPDNFNAPDSATSISRPSQGPASAARTVTRAISSALADTHKRLMTAAVAATRNPPMTPFERQRTSKGLGSDVV